jgi:hypothetical protein
MKFSLPAVALSVASLASAQFITSPQNGTSLVPGQPFQFTYEAQGGACADNAGIYQSYNYAVYLLTSDPAKTHLFPGHGGQLSTGRFLGRFPRGTSIRDAHIRRRSLLLLYLVPFTRNLTTPNFDSSQESQGNEPPVVASNRPVWLAVLEEIDSYCDVGILLVYPWQ